MSSTSILKNPSKKLDDLALYYVGDVAVIVMDAGENRLNTSFLKQFHELLDDVESNSGCKGLITTGKGKFYGNGLDLAWLGGQRTSEEMVEFFHLIHNLVLRILVFPLPTLAAINGHCFAGAALIAYAHDLRVQIKERGWLCLNEVWIERMFAKFHLLFLRTKLGGGNALNDAIVLGKRFTAQESLAAGLVHATTSETSLLPECVHLLKSHFGKSGFPRDSLQAMKSEVYRDAVDQARQDEAMISQRAEDKNVFNSKL